MQLTNAINKQNAQLATTFYWNLNFPSTSLWKRSSRQHLTKPPRSEHSLNADGIILAAAHLGLHIPCPLKQRRAETSAIEDLT